MVVPSLIKRIFKRVDQEVPFQVVAGVGVCRAIRDWILEQHCVLDLKSSEGHLIIIKIKLFTSQF